MSGKSLQVRLLAAGLVAMLAALGLAGAGLTLLFERHVERRAVSEAEAHLRTLIAGAGLDAQGRLTLAAVPADPKFAGAYGGLYWQARLDGAPALRSRSLWDVELALPDDAPRDGEAHLHDIAGPRGARLLAVERMARIGEETQARRLRVVVAQDRAIVAAARDAFARDLALALAALAAALALASFVQVRVGLGPLRAVRARLAQVREGAEARLPDVFPREVTPLAAEINTLLDARDAAIARARGRAADLAHGLKTPLTALAAQVRRLREAGQGAVADDIEALGAMMRRHVERELSRARIGGRRAGAGPTRLRPIVESICAAVARAPQAEGKGFDIDVDPALEARIDRADLEELLGALIENAARHARAVVRVAAARQDGALILEIADDGPGLAPEEAEQLSGRGERRDASPDGAGLGLALAADVAAAYGGALAFARAAEGGLSVRARLAEAA